MPIISKVARRSWKVRGLNWGIHAFLILGAVTMVYPFMILLSGSVKCSVDRSRLNVIPSYLFDNTMLYRKYIAAKYNEQTLFHACCTKRRVYNFEDVDPPQTRTAQETADWKAFLETVRPKINEFHYEIGQAYGQQIIPEMTRRFKAELAAEPDVHGSIEALNRKYDCQYVGWEQVYLSSRSRLSYERSYSGDYTPFERRCVGFINKRPWEDMIFWSPDAVFVETVLKVKYTPDIRRMNKRLGTTFRSWREVCLSRHCPAPGDPLRDDWLLFVREKLNMRQIEVLDVAVGYYRTYLRRKYADDIGLLNKRYGTTYQSFDDVPLVKETPTSGIRLADWSQFVATAASPEHLRLRTIEFMYRDFLRKKYCTIRSLNEAHENGVKEFSEIALNDAYPSENAALQDDWYDFAVHIADPLWLTAAFGAQKDYRDFVAVNFRRKIGDEEAVDFASLNAEYGTDYRQISDIRLPSHLPEDPRQRELWYAFLTQACDRKLLRLDAAAAATAWRNFLANKYRDAGRINLAYGLLVEDFDRAVMPLADFDYDVFLQRRTHILWEFLTRNYRIVLDLMAASGRAMQNTIIYCSLAILAALLVNPLAAYALSRYKPPSAHKILLFFMLPMAFPPMVLGIPNFLLMRNLGLLNTFAALILPGMANGYSIFLLKGFFDSLPRELYESAQVDGASEWTLFWQITMATSKPILAVIALNAFGLAYGNFMMAFIVCQDPKMWTIMVHIYQLQQRFSPNVTYAALVIAAIPTFLVFIFCQNIIIRGIVVPTEK